MAFKASLATVGFNHSHGFPAYIFGLSAQFPGFCLIFFCVIILWNLSILLTLADTNIASLLELGCLFWTCYKWDSRWPLVVFITYVVLVSCFILAYFWGPASTVTLFGYTGGVFFLPVPIFVDFNGLVASSRDLDRFEPGSGTARILRLSLTRHLSHLGPHGPAF